jgi:hypothetical protein
VGARTDAARQEAVAARTGLVEEVEALKASARNAVDVKAKVKRYPARAAGVAAGTAFVVAGGPRRVFRAVKRRVVGEPEPLPASLLPDEVDRAIRALGDDGGKVRGALERGFADYLDATAGDRKAAARSRSLSRFALGVATPVAKLAGREALKRVLAHSDRPGDQGSAR